MTSRKTAPGTDVPAAAQTKIAIVIDLLSRPGGATIEELARATGWQHHSVRGALAGALRRKGFTVTSDRTEGTRRYRIEGGE